MNEREEGLLRFRMTGLRAALEGGPTVEGIERQVTAIEDALDTVPDFAFDLCKALIESICKTMLADLGRPANPRWEAPELFRETTNRLSLLPPDHPNASAARDSIEKTMRGLLTTVYGLCELRNSYGMASHGRDTFTARLGLRQATLAAQAADTIAAFLYTSHRDSLVRMPGARVYYDDHADFNDALDRDYELIRIGGLELLPSRVLFHVDKNAYRVALAEFAEERLREDVGTYVKQADTEREE